MGKRGLGLEELQAACREYSNDDIPLMSPLSEKVEAGLKRIIPPECLDWVMKELISVEGFVSKKLALGLISFLVTNRETFEPNEERIQAIRRMVMVRFKDTIKFIGDMENISMNEASEIARGIDSFGRWGLTKSELNRVTFHLAQSEKIPLFGVLGAFVEMSQHQAWGVQYVRNGCIATLKFLGVAENQRLDQISMF